ncbi:hypothetical protein K0651_05285 [Ornithinimicrobium sp. Arc0846-15]|nr:hypothetical protein [Ornithinimicrobium laminariae]
MNQAPSPRARPGASWLAILVALGLIALAVVAVLDALVDQGLISGDMRLPKAVTAFDGIEPTNTVVAIAVILVLVGLWLTIAALKPSKFTHTATSGNKSVWISRAALEGSVRDAAGHTRGVSSVGDVSAGKSKITVSINTTADTQTVAKAVEAEVVERLRGFSDAKVVVRTRKDSA